MRILLTNDDGFHAPGLRAMRTALRDLGQVTVVAPATEQSAAGHSITLYQPLVAQEVREDGEFVGFAVEGRPADCVKLALAELIKEPPDLCVSGINAGSNAGINVLYSGTVGAAVEAAFFGVTSVAVSLSLPQPDHWPDAARHALEVVRSILNHRPAKGELFNVNIPCLAKGPPHGVRVAEQALNFYEEVFEARRDPRGRMYYWLKPDGLISDGHVDSDLEWLKEHYITVTPIQYDLTDHLRLKRMREWRWPTT